MKFSIILNSRGRPHLLENLLKSINNTTKDLDNIEILINCDSDDAETLVFADRPLELLVETRLRYYFSDRDRNLHKRLNKLARLAMGKYIFVLNDDCELITKDWDEIAFEILEKINSEIVYGRTQDTSCDKSGDKQYASFPIISKSAVDALGFFMHERFSGLGGDVGIYRVYKEIDRVVDIPIVIDHKLHSTVDKVLSPDIVAAEMRELSFRNGLDCFTFDISEDVKILREHEKNISHL